jgi:selenophosphate synthetase-related protein
MQALDGKAGRKVDGWQVPKLLDNLEREIPNDFAAWMTGYARVTVNASMSPANPKAVHRIIVASPLYVELAGQP